MKVYNSLLYIQEYFEFLLCYCYLGLVISVKKQTAHNPRSVLFPVTDAACLTRCRQSTHREFVANKQGKHYIYADCLVINNTFALFWVFDSDIRGL